MFKLQRAELKCTASLQLAGKNLSADTSSHIASFLSLLDLGSLLLTSSNFAQASRNCLTRMEQIDIPVLQADFITGSSTIEVESPATERKYLKIPPMSAALFAIKQNCRRLRRINTIAYRAP